MNTTFDNESAKNLVRIAFVILLMWLMSCKKESPVITPGAYLTATFDNTRGEVYRCTTHFVNTQQCDSAVLRVYESYRLMHFQSTTTFEPIEMIVPASMPAVRFFATFYRKGQQVADCEVLGALQER